MLNMHHALQLDQWGDGLTVNEKRGAGLQALHGALHTWDDAILVNECFTSQAFSIRLFYCQTQYPLCYSSL